MASALRSAILRRIRVPVTQSLAVNGSLLTAVRSMSSHGDDHPDNQQVIDRVLDVVKCFPKVDPSKNVVHVDCFDNFFR
ncbi:mitochondrial acyl carrier protein 1 [Perilla frutescens var. hirtella]|uniref:Mitochondrial acyl carrier protein 1 n=1 Tax=Perilla frutescens var. hirtella TaxID=608512 RepID=A0AAD4JEN4_PERFH|nr:mitochondrial acyl carrier protein 1 [Perilla frutescens var. hirtella]KAH6831753.1 mitochondrial acyl carrier protein 1 [Perilla frutescens var. hirtella]